MRIEIDTITIDSKHDLDLVYRNLLVHLRKLKLDYYADAGLNRKRHAISYVCNREDVQNAVIPFLNPYRPEPKKEELLPKLDVFQAYARGVQIEMENDGLLAIDIVKVAYLLLKQNLDEAKDFYDTEQKVNELIQRAEKLLED